jgi:hypothetical protein
VTLPSTCTWRQILAIRSSAACRLFMPAGPRKRIIVRPAVPRAEFAPSTHPRQEVPLGGGTGCT